MLSKINASIASLLLAKRWMVWLAMSVLSMAGPAAHTKDEAQSPLTMAFGGDVVWSPGLKQTPVVFGAEDPASRTTDTGSRRLPFIANEKVRAYFTKRFGRDLATEKDAKHYRDAALFGFGGDPTVDPLRYLRTYFTDADIAFINLETPLSDSARWSGKFRTPTGFADNLVKAGIDIVSTANNHAFDAEGQGLLDTIETLGAAGIRHVGTGKNLSDAVAPVFFEQKETKIAFLAFSYGVNPTSSPIGFATPSLSGVAPLDEFLVKRQIAAVRSKVDLVVLSLHWGLQNTYEVHPDDRALAHRLVDAGADLIVGHHPHVPRAVEQYNGGLILYSLGNLVFNHGHSYWGDNLLVRVTVKQGKIHSARLHMVSGRGVDVFAPKILEGDRAVEELARIVTSSGSFGTELTVTGNQADILVVR